MQHGINVAIIMDGNGRWAIQRGKGRSAGHRAGVETLAEIVRAAQSLGVASLTVYAFSSNNWQRPTTEVDALMALFQDFLARGVQDDLSDVVRLTVIGRRDRLPADIATAIANAESSSAHRTGLHLRVAFDYSATSEIARCARACTGGAVTREALARQLASDGGPTAIDLLIRTGGEKRLSDFLLFEAAYAELYFTDTLWPDFGVDEFEFALRDFASRERRFGALPEPRRDEVIVGVAQNGIASDVA